MNIEETQSGYTATIKEYSRRDHFSLRLYGFIPGSSYKRSLSASRMAADAAQAAQSQYGAPDALSSRA